MRRCEFKFLCAISIVGHWACSIWHAQLYRNIVRIPRDPRVLRLFNNCMSRVHDARVDRLVNKTPIGLSVLRTVLLTTVVHSNSNSRIIVRLLQSPRRCITYSQYAHAVRKNIRLQIAPECCCRLSTTA